MAAKVPEKMAISAAEVGETPLPPYPERYWDVFRGRKKRALGDQFGLNRIGVNITTLEPGCVSSLHHRHSAQEELIFVLRGSPTLITDEGEVQLKPEMVAGFKPGGAAHHLENRSSDTVTILEIGERTAGDFVDYPNDDLVAKHLPSGQLVFLHKDGSTY